MSQRFYSALLASFDGEILRILKSKPWSLTANELWHDQLLRVQLNIYNEYTLIKLSVTFIVSFSLTHSHTLTPPPP